MNITFRQMQLFNALSKTGSVSAAAKMLHITQPTASMQLKEITDAVGLPLYEVISKRIHLTEHGKQLAQTVNRIQEEWDLFEQKTAQVKGHQVGKLRIAIVSTAKYFIPKMLGEFCNSYPEIEISLEVLNRNGVITRLEQNQDDMYVMSMPPTHIDIDDTTFMENPLVVIAPLNHHLAKHKNINISDLKDEKFVLRERGSGTRMSCDNHFAKLDFKPLIRMELGNNEAIKQAVSSGMGLSILSTHSLEYNHATDDVSILNVAEFPIMSQWHIVTLRGKQLSPIAQKFYSHLKDIS